MMMPYVQAAGWSLAIPSCSYDPRADADSYGTYKKQVSMAARQHGMQAAQAGALLQSIPKGCSLSAFLGSDVPAVPNTVQPYLAGIGPAVRTRPKLQFCSAIDAVAHRKQLVAGHSRRHE
jgi:hypothetical protein